MASSIRVYIISFVLAVLAISSPSCRSKKNIPISKNVEDTTIVNPNCKLDFKSARTLNGLLKKNEFDFRWISAKFEASVLYNNKTIDFDVNMKGRKDSVIWMSITDPLLGAIEGARVMLTCDTVKFMDRQNKQFFIGGYDTLRKMLNIDDLDFRMLQSLLVGNSVEFYEDEEKLKPGMDRHDCKYLLGTIRKRKLRRAMIGVKELKDPAQSIWLEPDKFKILRIFFTDFNTNRTFDANYETFETVDSLLFPHKLSFEIKAERNMLIRIRYNKVGINKEVAFPYNIPLSYTPIQNGKN